MKTKKYLATVITFLASLALTGCVVEQEASEDRSLPESPSEISEYADTSAETQEMARTVLRDQHPEDFGSLSDGTLDDLGETACEALDAGVTMDALFLTGMDVYGPTTGAILAFAVFGYCPEHEDKFEAWTES